MTMVTATVSGFDAVMAKLKNALGSDLQRAAEQAVYTEAQFVVTEAIPITPVDTETCAIPSSWMPLAPTET